MKNSIDNFVDLLAQSEDFRAAVRVTEVTGVRTVFTREERNVAILLSWDEYASLTGTASLAGDPGRLERIRAADEEIARTGGQPLEEVPAGAENVRVAGAAAASLQALSGDSRAAALRALAAIAGNPIAGAPLVDPLRGFWLMGSEGVRIVYRVSRDGSMAGVVLVDRAEEES